MPMAIESQDPLTDISAHFTLRLVECDPVQGNCESTVVYILSKLKYIYVNVRTCEQQIS